MLCNCVPADSAPSNHDLPLGIGNFAEIAESSDLDDRAARRVVLVPRTHPLRRDAEACIESVYDRAFGARDLEFAPTLIAWVGKAGRPLCAAGLRTVADGFFSEAYLDAPIDWLLSARTAGPVRREAIFEVTMLASRSPEASSGFLRQIALLGRRAGFEWSFFTATAHLRKLLWGLGIPTLELAPADPRRLPDAERWGSYYDHAPEVCAVNDRWLDDGVGR